MSEEDPFAGPRWSGDVPAECFACGSPQVRAVTTTRFEMFDDGERLVLRDVPIAECARCGRTETEDSVSSRVVDILRLMEFEGPDTSSYLDRRWIPRVERSRRQYEEYWREFREAEPIDIDEFLAECGPYEPTEPYPQRCEPCDRDAERSLRHDSMWCAVCNRWLEERCDLPDCMFCDDRPERPSLAEPDEVYDGEQAEPDPGEWPPWLADLSWPVVQNLLGGLREAGQRRLAHTAPDLRVWGLCDCGRCGSFRTVPRLRGDRRKRIDATTWLFALDGIVNVDIHWDEGRGEYEIAGVEIIDRPDLAVPLREAWQSYQERRASWQRQP